MTAAFLFPGQGILRPRSVAAWLSPRRRGAEVFDAAVRRWGLVPRQVLSMSPRQLQSVDVSHRLVAALCLGEVERLEGEGIRPTVGAGHSLGSLVALIAAGALAEEDGFRLFACRARWMGEAARRHPGAMLAVRNLAASGLRSAIRAGRLEGRLVVAARNGVCTWVLSGDLSAVAAAHRHLRRAGVPAVLLPVQAAYHSPLMASAARGFRDELAAVRFTDPLWPLVSTARGGLLRDRTEVRRDLDDHMLRPVRWTLVLETLQRLQVKRIIAAGPGGLAGVAVSPHAAGGAGG